MQNSFKPVARKENLVIQEASDEVLVYDLRTNKAHCLNSTAAFIWRSCDGDTSVSDIGAKLTAESGSQVPSELVWLAIDQLEENGLLAKGSALVNFGASRREMLKKLGLAAVVALPVVATLVAPKSAMASASCVCGTVADCSGGCPTAGCAAGVCV